jgi:hypothetical protein
VHWPDPRTLLEAWERGLAQPPQNKVLTLLSAFLPQRTLAELAALPVGRRDATLLDIREQLFGSTLCTVVACPGCGEELEADVPIGEIRTGSAADAGRVRTLSAAGHNLAYRLPTTGDLLAIAEQPDVGAARGLLLSRCVLEARDAEANAIDPLRLPEAVTRALAARMSRADPQADISLSLVCPACEQGFAALLDIATFLLRDLHHWARQMLGDIHAIASAYGWNEGEILSLSPARRRAYLEMIVQ